MDGTYKLLYSNHPAGIAGWSDSDKRFYPVCFALFSVEDTVCYGDLFEGLRAKGVDPETILGDGSSAISSGMLFSLK